MQQALQDLQGILQGIDGKELQRGGDALEVLGVLHRIDEYLRAHTLGRLDLEGQSAYGADVSVDIREVRNLTIVKESKGRKGFAYGALAGAGTAALIGVLAGATGDGVMFYVPILGLGFFGGVLGALFGAAAGRDETILVSTKTNAEIQDLLNRLRSLARVPEYQ